MTQWQKVGTGIGLAVLFSPFAASGASPAVERAQLKANGLQGPGNKTAVQLVGFSWGDESREFEDGVAMADLTPPKTQDQSFSILGKGGSAVCEGLRQSTSNGNRLGKARLTFKGEKEAGVSFKLGGVAIARADCEATPWKVTLVAQEVAPGTTGEKAKKLKKQGEAVRMERVGSGG